MIIGSHITDIYNKGRGNGVKYNYDSIGRLKDRVISTGTLANQSLKTSFEYSPGKAVGDKVSTTTQVKSIDNNGKKIEYTHDKNGNIESITENGKVIKYYYNELNELIREDNKVLNKTITYSYDLGGNIKAKIEYPHTTEDLGIASKTYSYGYDTTWKDKLTSFDGKTITYDAIGNPLGYNGDTYTWEQGRQLAGMTGNGKTITFKYNDSGIRTQKTVNGVTTTYHLVGDKVTYEESATDKIYFTYDSSDDLISMNLSTKNPDGTWTVGVEYYYIRNAQGDIIGLYDGNGTQVVSYSYDSWANMVSIDGALKDSVGVKNPYRYRGYRFDSEAGLYYLQSRYYNAEWGRYLNADDTDVLDGGNDHILENNLFAYCFNNPVNMSDDDGYWPSWVTKVLIGVAAIGVGVAVTALTGGAALGAVSHRKSTGSWGGAGKAALTGAINGAVDGFMAGGIMAGASQVASAGFKVAAKTTVNAGKKVSGIKLTKNIKVLSPDKLYLKNNGGTLLKVGRAFRVDVGSNTLFHMHFPGALSSTHFQIGTIDAGLYGGLKR